MRCMYRRDMAAWIPPGALVLTVSHTGLLVVALHRPSLCLSQDGPRLFLLPRPIPNQSMRRSLAVQ